MTFITGIVLIGILIFVHELGHFLVAKALGVRVLTFSLGFGQRIVSKTWGGTEYRISAFPLGGYVQMLGEGGGEMGEHAELTPEEKKHSFSHKPASSRIAIIGAGPLMNLVFPFLVLPVAYLVGVDLPVFLEEKPCIGYVLNDTQGSRAGFQTGDCIVGLGGQKVETWSETNRLIVENAGSPLEFTVEREMGRQILVMSPESGEADGLRSLGLFPSKDPIVGAVTPGTPAEAAGLLAGDRVLAIDGNKMDSWYDLRPEIQQGGATPRRFTIERQGQRIDLDITPAQPGGINTAYLVGVSPFEELALKRFGFTEALREGVGRATDLIKLTTGFIKKLVFGEVSGKNLGGPIAVVKFAGEAAQSGVSSILMGLAFLSIQLGILNLLPIPVLDGGHLCFAFLEICMRRPLSVRIREVAQQIGLAALGLLMIYVFYNDITRLIFGITP